MIGRWFNGAPRADILMLVVCVGLSLLLQFMDEGRRAVLADRLGDVFRSPVAEMADFYRAVKSQGNDLARLQQELFALEMQVATADRIQRDAARMAGPALEAGYAGDVVPCRVVTRRSSRFATMLKIRSLEPVAWRPWQPVVSRTGYLGRVYQVLGNDEAWVELLSAPEFALGVEVVRNGVYGVLRPRGDRLVVELVGRDADVQVGDELITSGIAEVPLGAGDDRPGATPRGFPVGRVVRAAAPTERIFKDIEIEAAATLAVNETVFVIVDPETGGGS